MRAMHLRRRAEDAEHATQGTPLVRTLAGRRRGLVLLVPLVGTDMLGLQPDLYRQRRRRWPGCRATRSLRAVSPRRLTPRLRTTPTPRPTGGRDDNQHPGQRGTARGDDEPDQVPPRAREVLRLLAARVRRHPAAPRPHPPGACRPMVHYRGIHAGGAQPLRGGRGPQQLRRTAARRRAVPRGGGRARPRSAT